MNASKKTWLSIGVFSLMLGLPSVLMAEEGLDLKPIENNNSPSQVIELGQTGPNTFDPYRAAMHSSQMPSGNWIWTNTGDPLFTKGVTAVGYSKPMAILLAGGPGYIATSRDNGLTWTKSLNLAQNTDNPQDQGYDDDDDNDAETLSNDERARLVRDHIEAELETQYGSDYVDILLDEITDEELLTANDMHDIESLSLLELNFDTDLTQLKARSSQERISSLGLAPYGSYFERFTQLIDGGADYEQAEILAAQRDGVWQFARADNRVLAITNDTLYISNDGLKWTSLLTAPSDKYFLDVDVSANAQIIVVGMTDGLQISEDAGKSWKQNSNVLEGVVFDVALGKAPGSRALYALTTEGWLYASQDLGDTWTDLTPHTDIGETVIQILPSILPKRVIALSASTIFITEDLNTWSSIPHAPFENESLLQISSSDPRLETFVVRGSKQIYAYQNGWVSQNTALFTRQLGQVLDAPIGMLTALLATPSGLWVALSSTDAIDVNTRHDTLSALWLKEPSDKQVLKQALIAHYIEDTDPSWTMRSRLSWLLPKVVFNYRFSQNKRDRTSETTNTLTGIYTAQQFFSRRQTINEWQIMGYWDFNFASKDGDEIRAIGLATRQNDLRLSITDEVERALMTRRQLQMSGIEQSNDIEKEINRILAIDEIEAQLHYLTGGYYKVALGRR